MTAAGRAITAAEPRNWHRQIRTHLHQLALVTSGKYPAADHKTLLGQLVNMPVHRLAAPHVARKPRFQSARALSGADKDSVRPARLSTSGRSASPPRYRRARSPSHRAGNDGVSSTFKQKRISLSMNLLRLHPIVVAEPTLHEGHEGFIKRWARLLPLIAAPETSPPECRSALRSAA